MKNKSKAKKKLIVYLNLLIGILLLSSCSNNKKIGVDYSFKAAINVKQNIENFNQVDFKSFDNLNLGFHKGNVWIKLDVLNNEKPSSYIVLTNDLINRNYVFYKLDKLNNVIEPASFIKDLTKQDHRTFNYPNPNFKIDLKPNEKATYIIITNSDGRTIDATPKLVSTNNYYTFINQNTAWSIIFIGSVFFLLLLNIYLWNIHKQKIFLYYIFYMLFTLIMYIGLEGHLYRFGLKHITIDHIIFLTIRFWEISLILYTLKFLRVKEVNPKYNKFVWWLLFLVLGGNTLYQFTFYSSSIQYLHYYENVLSSLWLLLILVTVLISAKSRKLELKYYLIPLFCFLVFIVIGLIDGHFQVFPGSPFIYIKIGTLIEFVGFTYFMTSLIKRKIQRGDNLLNELQERSEELVEKSKKLEELNKILETKTVLEKTDLINVFTLLESSLTRENEWESFKEKFKSLNPNFLNLLLEKNSGLSKSEIRLLTLIRIGYSQKEIANILNIAPDSVKKARQRVRKKLTIPKSSTLREYLLNLDQSN
jgi:DNA-binding CsgD family transcriptional regulator